MKEIGFAESATERASMYTAMVRPFCALPFPLLHYADFDAIQSMMVVGSKYEGSWENDRINGEGTSWYNNGNRYHGEWLNGRINGLGTLYLASGDRYSGDWKDGRRHGQGTYFYRFSL